MINRRFTNLPFWWPHRLRCLNDRQDLCDCATCPDDDQMRLELDRSLETRGSGSNTFRTGTNGVSTNGVTATFILFDIVLFWVLPFTYFRLPKSARAYLFSNPSTFITFATAPLMSTPCVRKQAIPCSVIVLTHRGTTQATLLLGLRGRSIPNMRQASRTCELVAPLGIQAFVR